MVYGTDVVLPINLALPLMKIWKYEKEEPNHFTRTINQLIELQQHRVKVDKILQKYQDDMKTLFHRKTKDKEFLLGDLVLIWDARKEDFVKHGKFDHIWYGPFRVVASEGKIRFY
jgi:hypothetical protein